MGCETFLDNFFRISGMFYWAVALIAIFVIYKQKEMIKATMRAKKAANKMKEMIGGNDEELEKNN